MIYPLKIFHQHQVEVLDKFSTLKMVFWTKEEKPYYLLFNAPKNQIIVRFCLFLCQLFLSSGLSLEFHLRGKFVRKSHVKEE